MNKVFVWVLGIVLTVFTGCESNRVIVNDIDEREANELIVFLASRGINAQKVASSSGSGRVGDNGPVMWGIAVEDGKTTDAMALLNQNGLPRRKGTNLLELFAKQGLMSTDKEETIRYQAGLEQQIANTILNIDGITFANVCLSIPPAASPGSLVSAAPAKVKAAVLVKHLGVMDDPNSHLEIKIKRLVSGSVPGLDLNDVTVIATLARFNDITLKESLEAANTPAKDYTSVWSIVLSQQSVTRFQLLFFTLITTNITALLMLGWVVWKFYPTLRRAGGLKELLNPLPIKSFEPSELKE
jgi:type III secretion protein J